MGVVDWIKNYFGTMKYESASADTVYIDVPQSLYIMEMAVYCATSLIANAISQCEIVCYQKGERVKDENYYSLNIKPNPNESASQFWHKVAEKALKSRDGKGALCFINGRNLYCADEYTLESKRPFLGNIYSGVVIDDFQMNRKFTADQVFIFKLENKGAYEYINRMHMEYGPIIAAAREAYKNGNVKKYVLKVDGVKAGDDTFVKEWEDILKNALKSFVGNESNLYVQYSGRELSQMKNEDGTKSSDDLIKLTEEIFKMAGKAYKIPESLMLGNITNMNDVVKAFLTFGVDPWADMIGKTLTGQYGMDEWIKGNYYKVDTSGVNHVDIFDMADKIDKLISSSFANVNEVRNKAGLDEIKEEWADKHMLTKNYSFIDKGTILGLENGGVNN